MVAAAVLHPQAECGDLGLIDVHTRGAVLALGNKAIVAKRVDDGLFHQLHQLAHLETAAREVDEEVGDELAGAVIGDLSATVDVHQRDGGGIVQQVLRLARLAEGVHRRVLQQPDLIFAVGATPGCVGTHGLERRRVVHHTQTLDDHSTTLTMGCEVSSR
ncbi:hypothetical protein MASR2M16_07060 [Thauera terpenica]